MNLFYQVLNVFFFVFHTAFTLFNIFGWISRKTRAWHLFTMAITAFSWFILGIWFGWGYCVCTHWHWAVREKLGYHDTQTSYIQFLVYKLTGIPFPIKLVETITLAVFLAALFLNVLFTLLARKKKTA